MSRDVSAAPSSAGDTIDDHNEDVKPRIADLETEELSTVEAGVSTETPTAKSSRRKAPASRKKAKPKKGSHVWIAEGPPDGTEDEGSVISTGAPRSSKRGEGTPDIDRTIGTAVGTRRQANGTVGSVYSGSKIRHIKKPDGTPLWRKEIQYEFLHLVVGDSKGVFTQVSDGDKNRNFADIYIDCLARSSKTSKILKERLQLDREAAQNMAMICLLVNVGRMNTTLNFFPEMRAQLRTYHSIPSLQAYETQRDYKSLQDAPRLKSILKGASEDNVEEPRSLQLIQQMPIPRTNPVNLIFVLAQYAPKISEAHFTDKVDFFDLTMRSTISSRSRARAFLWLMWWYLESDFTKEAALNNPFGPGGYKEGENPEDPQTIPLLVPALEHITEEEGDAENVDTETEKEFAEKMTKERKRVMAEVANEPPLAMADPGHKLIKRLKRSAAMLGDDDSMISDAESRASPGVGRSPGPDFAAGGHALSTTLAGANDSVDDDWEAVDPHPGRGRYKRVRGKNTPSRLKGDGGRSSIAGSRSLKKHARGDDTPEVRSTPQPLALAPGTSSHPIISQYGPHRSRNGIESARGNDANSGGPTKPRARTGYQRELEEHRNRRIEWALRKRRRDTLQTAKEIRDQSRWLLRTARRVSELPATYDSEEDEEAGSFGLGGILGRRWAGGMDETDNDIPAGYEVEDYGEEADSWLKILRRTSRRMEVWAGDSDVVTSSARPGYAEVIHYDGHHKRRLGHSRRGAKRAAASIGDGPGVAEKDLDDQITQDLLAERSDEEMLDQDEDNLSGNDGEGEDSDMDVD